MKLTYATLLFFLFSSLQMVAHSSEDSKNKKSEPVNQVASQESNFIDSGAYDPRDPNINEILSVYDKYYESETGRSPWLNGANPNDLYTPIGGCWRDSCAVYIHVSKIQQHAYLFVDGQLFGQWAVSTGQRGYGTPDFDRHPNGRIYERYSSKKYPGGDYNGLGNMPFAVFIEGGFALHGTPRGNWSKLGRRASHGCIRMHPNNAEIFNHLVRQAGIEQTWITVSNEPPFGMQPYPPRQQPTPPPRPPKPPQERLPEIEPERPRTRYSAYNACMRENRHIKPVSRRIERCQHLR